MIKAWQRFRQWFDSLPPIMAPGIDFPVPLEESDAGGPSDDTTFVVVLPPGILSWVVAHMPAGDVITREEAAATLLQREIQVRYRPMIIEMDRKTP